MKPEIIAASLPLKASPAEIRQAAEQATNAEVLTRENIPGYFSEWNDYFNQEVGNSVHANVMTFKEFVERTSEWHELAVEYLIQQIEDALEKRAETLQALYDACTNLPDGKIGEVYVAPVIPKSVYDAYTKLRRITSGENVTLPTVD